MKNKANYNTIPVGQLGIIALPGCEEIAKNSNAVYNKEEKTLIIIIAQFHKHSISL